MSPPPGLLASIAKDLAQNRLYAITVAVISGITLAILVTVSSLNALLLFKPLPYAEAEQLVDVHADVAMGGQRAAGNSVAFMLAWREHLAQSGSFTAAEASSARVRISGVDARRGMSYVEPGFFELFGKPEHGAGFSGIAASELRDPVVVISHELAQQLGTPIADIVGTQLDIDSKPHRVIGVMGRDFMTPQLLAGMQDSFWLPLDYTAEQAGAWRGFSSNRHLYGRLAPGASHATVQAGLQGLTGRLLAVEAAPHLPPGYQVEPKLVRLREAVVGDGYRAGLVLLAATLLLTVLSLSIVLSLLVARWAKRRPELALHAVLGARGSDIRWMVAGEAACLMALAFIVSVPVAWLCTAAIRNLAQAQLPRLAELRVDPMMLLWILACGCAMAVVLSCAAAWRLRDPRIIDSIRSGSKGGLAGGSNLQRQALLTLQLVALAATLHLGTLLLLDSGHRLLMSPGYTEDGSSYLQVEVPDALRSAADKEAIANELAAAVGALSPATTTALVDMPPVSRGLALFDVSGSDGSPICQMMINGVGPEYLDRIGMHLEAGRLLQVQDYQQHPDAIVLGASAARLVAGAGNPVGMKVLLDGKMLTVVGVVNDILNPVAQQDAARLQGYVPYRHYDGVPSIAMFLFGNDPIDGAALTTALDRVRQGLVLDTFVPTHSLRGELVQEFYVKAAISVALILLAATMALAGVHAVVSYLFEQLRGQLALEIALGARRQDLMQTITGVVRLPLALAVVMLMVAGFVFRDAQQAYFQLSETQLILVVLIASLVLAMFVLAAAKTTGGRLIDRGYHALLTELQ